MSYNIINTPFKIQGKKTKFLPFILDAIKKSNIDFNTLIEPFFGSGVVGFNILKNLPQFDTAYFADINKYIIDFYHHIINDGLDISKVKDQLEIYSEDLESKGSDFYYQIRDEFNSKKNIEYLKVMEETKEAFAKGENAPSSFYDFRKIIIQFLFLNRTCFNGLIRFNKDGNFNVPYCKNDKRLTPSLIKEIITSLEEIDKICEDKEIWFGISSFDVSINAAVDYIDKDKTLIYCDPPYIKRNTNYVNKDWTIDDEIKLRDTLINSGCKFMVSNWLADSKCNINENVKEIWGDFKTIYAPSHKYIVGPTGEERPQVTEILITNF